MWLDNAQDTGGVGCNWCPWKYWRKKLKVLSFKCGCTMVKTQGCVWVSLESLKALEEEVAIRILWMWLYNGQDTGVEWGVTSFVEDTGRITYQSFVIWLFSGQAIISHQSSCNLVVQWSRHRGGVGYHWLLWRHCKKNFLSKLLPFDYIHISVVGQWSKHMDRIGCH